MIIFRILHCWRTIAATTLKSTFLHKWTVSCSSQSFAVLLVITDITSRCQLSFRTLNHLSPSAGLITREKPWAGCYMRRRLCPSRGSLLGPDSASIWCFSCRLRRSIHLLRGQVSWSLFEKSCCWTWTFITIIRHKAAIFISGPCSEVFRIKLSKSRLHNELFRANKADKVIQKWFSSGVFLHFIKVDFQNT